jgi:predicted nucleic acid-binding protein
VASNSGFLDTNVIIHALTNDGHSSECRRFLEEVEAGRIRVKVDPLVIHELTYALPRYRRQFTRADVAEIAQSILASAGVDGSTGGLQEAVSRWAETPGLGFVDAYLAVLALQNDCPVYTKNVREIIGQGVTVPDPLI